MTSPPANAGQRTLAGDLTAAAAFGAQADGGISRFAWTPELAEVTTWVGDELRRLGLDVQIDAAGNLIGKWPAPSGSAVMAGSHLDTVRHGGAFDGVLGVLAAVEAVRLLKAEGFEPSRPIWVAAFMDEEGTRFGTALFGSRAFCGHDLSAVVDTADAGGIRLREAMRSWDRDADRLGEADQISGVGSYLELHIEQGPVLWSRGERLAVVESICGVLGFRITFRGETNHAGSTPTDMRRDALVGASRLVLALRAAAEQRPELRATVGRICAAPGGRNVIPGLCEMTVDLRSATPEAFSSLEPWLRKLAAGAAADEDLTAEVHCDYAVEPRLMHPDIMAAIEAAASDEDVEPSRMVSGGGHDAMVVAHHADVGMLFVPSRNGISHSPEEWTDSADCELGSRVLAGALRRLAGQRG